MPSDNLLHDLLDVYATALADVGGTLDGIAPSSDKPPTKDEIRQALQDRFDEAVKTGVLEPPFSDIRYIRRTPEGGDCRDAEGNYLLSLTSTGVDEVVRLLNEVTVIDEGGAIELEKDRFG